jgi:hypothetical protein
MREKRMRGIFEKLKWRNRQQKPKKRKNMEMNHIPSTPKHLEYRLETER